MNRLAILAVAQLLATVAGAAPVITEIYYNPPGTSEAAFEWIEVYNPGPGDLDISGMVVESRGAASPRLATVPAATPALAQGDYAVLAGSSLLGVNCRTAARSIVLTGSFSLNNTNDTGPDNPRIALFPAGTTDVVSTTPLDLVAYREGGFPTADDGVSLMLVDVGADNYLSSSWSASPGLGSGCLAYATNTSGSLYGSPGRANDWCYRGAGVDAGTSEDAAIEDAAIEDGSIVTDAGTPAAEPVCLTSGFDAGIADSAVASDSAVIIDATQADSFGLDAGLIDLGPQNPPTIVLSQPASAATVNPTVDIVYAASDPDGDALSVALFYAVDDSGYDGVLIAGSLEAQGTYTWRPTAVPEGTYRVFGRATDARGGLAFAYAAGPVTVPPAAVQAPQLTLVSPTGNEGEVSGLVDIAFTHNDIPGTIDLFFDTDNRGYDGVAILGGIAVPGGPTRVQWDTSEVPAGSYFVHGRYQTATGVATAYSPGSVTVIHPQEGCQCRGVAAPAGAATGFLTLTTLFLLRRRRPATWR
ncbi:MAG: lamin tail domain-containing protein [Pseudomonadota bacterium]